jgi:glycosyltransferase involved in cell wall biosynthesis
LRQIGLFHPGRQHSWQTAAALNAAGALAWHATAIYYDPNRLPYRAAAIVPGRTGEKMRRLLQRRAHPLLDTQRIRHLPALEWLELSLARLGWRAAANRANSAGNALFQRAVLRLLQREPVDLLWGYDTSCDFVFAHPEAQASARVLDQSIAHPSGLREQLLEARESFGDFSFDQEIPDEAECRRASAEIAAASHVIVGSAYAAKLAQENGAAVDRLHVCAYGYEEANFPVSYQAPPGIGSLPVRFVFVGTVSMRKGFHLLARVFAKMPRHLATLTIVGPNVLPDGQLEKSLGNIEYHPAVPNSELRRLLANSHCFVFPSLHEGGGIVLYEAAACGLGIIQSATCGDGVRVGSLGENGIVLRENTVDALREAVERVIANPAILRDWSAASWAMREERSWSAYRRRIVELLPQLQ